MIDFYSAFMQDVFRVGVALAGVLFTLELLVQLDSQLILNRLKESGKKIASEADPRASAELVRGLIYLIARKFPIEAFVREGAPGRSAVIRFLAGLRAERTGIEPRRAR